MEYLLFYSLSAGAGWGFLPIKLFGTATNTTKMAVMPTFLINPNVQLLLRSPRVDRLVHLLTVRAPRLAFDPPTHGTQFFERENE